MSIVAYPIPHGTLHFGPRDWRAAHLSARAPSWLAGPEAPLPGAPVAGSMSVPAAIIAARDKGLRGNEAVGFVATAADLEFTDAVVRLHDEDRATLATPRTFAMKDRTFFAAPRHDPWAAMSPEQRRAMAERWDRDAHRPGQGLTDRDGRGNLVRR